MLEINNFKNKQPKIAVITHRAGMRIEGGEWNLIHGRNKALINNYNADILQIMLIKYSNNLGNDYPAHWKDQKYKLEVIHYNNHHVDLAKKTYKATRLALNWDPDIIVFSGGMAGMWYWLGRLFSRKTKTVWDVHGATKHETIEYNKSNKYLFCLLKDHLNEKYMLGIDGILVVSEELKKYVMQDNRRSEIFIVPCSTNVHLKKEDIIQHRDSWRNKFGIPRDEWVIVYAGSLGVWQATEEILADYIDLGRKLPDTWMVFYVSNDKEILYLEDYKEKHGLKKFIVKSIKSEMLHEALCVADVGLVLRHNNVTNRVAFPNKIDDYLASGVAIATTEGLPAAAELIKRNMIKGIVLDKVTLNGIEILRDATKDRNKDEIVTDWEKSQICRKKISYEETLRHFVDWVA